MFIAIEGPSFSGKSFIAKSLYYALKDDPNYENLDVKLIKGSGFVDTERSQKIQHRSLKEADIWEKEQRYWNISAMERYREIAETKKNNSNAVIIADRSIFTNYVFDEKARKELFLALEPDFLIYVDNDLAYMEKKQILKRIGRQFLLIEG